MQIAVWESGTGGGVHLALMQLRTELKALPSNQQRCLEMKIEGYSYEETAAATGLEVDAVRSHLQNARRTLRIKMQGTLSEIA
jgi:RNA polymerase sigma-70 factor (ECF subfamily)